MTTLIAEDDFVSRLLLQEILAPFGAVHIAVNGREAIDAVRAAWAAGQTYDLICLDVMMPEADGMEVLKTVRSMEQDRGARGTRPAKIFMVTALSRMKNVSEAFQGLCDEYLVKPIDKGALLKKLSASALIA